MFKTNRQTLKNRQMFQLQIWINNLSVYSLLCYPLIIQMLTLLSYSFKLSYVFNEILFFFAGGSSGRSSGGTGSRNNNKGGKDVPLVSQSLVYQVGETANLPCDISVPKNNAPNDELMLIMWYREDVRSPIYSIGKSFILGSAFCLFWCQMDMYIDFLYYFGHTLWLESREIESFHCLCTFDTNKLQGGKPNFAGCFFPNSHSILRDIELIFCIETLQTFI